MSGMQRFISSIALALVCAAPAGALTVPFTEDFALGASGWVDAVSGPLVFHASGGPDGSSYVSTTRGSINNPGTIQFRGNAANGASGGAFVGDWDGNVTLLSAEVTHDAPDPLTFFFRITSTPGSAFVGVVPVPVLPNVWTEISLAIDPLNPLLIAEGPVSFSTVFGNVLNLQVGVSVPVAQEGVPFTYGLDQVTIVPEPTTAALLIGGLLAITWTERRRR